MGHRPVLYKNALECLRLSVQREGLKSLWLGTGAAYVKIFPQLAITYFVFELRPSSSAWVAWGGTSAASRLRTRRWTRVPSGPVAA